MQDAGGMVHGLQFILPSHHPRRRKTGRDKEYWPAGLAKQGHWFQLGSVINSGVCLVAEGYATAATLHAATGLPVAVAFDANNLKPVAVAIKKAYKTSHILLCADDDYLTEGNPGCKAADEAARAVGGAWIKPEFPGDREGKKITDFNDLQNFPAGGLHLVRVQVDGILAKLAWVSAGAGLPKEGGGESAGMPSMLTVDEAVYRFWGTYGLGGKVMFDEVERRLVHKDDVMNLLPERSWAEVKKHPAWRVARDTEIGFDPTEADKAIRCNLFGGWPTVPKSGACDRLLELLYYLCSKEQDARGVHDWILKWLAYPLQHRGAKMHSAIVVHGPQGTGKSRFFEAYAEIFGPYGRVLGQEAIEDKFNADWAEKKLFILADEVLARQDLYHIKNRLKGFITGGTIRVNPKNVAAHTEKNQMNIVFLSNERQPIILENDDRRHAVIYCPPKPDEQFFREVNGEIANGGVAALHHYLLKLDLGDFKPWTKPPMTAAKQDLIDLSLGSEERFVKEWKRLELEGKDGQVFPFCPCLGSHLYLVYEDWCKRNGEFRPRPSNHFINFLAKQPGWTAGRPEKTWVTMADKTVRNRKMVVPADKDQIEALRLATDSHKQADLAREKFGTKAEWLTACFFAFESAMEARP
jgi:putative DNA primase/helicase